MADAPRVILYDRNCEPIGDLSPNDIHSLVRTEEINGENKLEIETGRILEVGTRVLMRDETLAWHEYVVNEADEEHSSGRSEVGKYQAVWSLQWDLSHWVEDGDLGHVEVGIRSSATGADALRAVLGTNPLWSVGTSDAAVTAGGGCVMIAESAWDKLRKAVKAWNAETGVTLTVGSMGVTSRRVNLMAAPVDSDGVLSSPVSMPSRRFEWGYDLTSVRRVPDPGPYYCRIVPIGKATKEYAEGTGGAADDTVEFDWPMSLLDQPEYWPPKDGRGNVIPQPFWDGHEYLTDPVTENVFRYRDGESGGWVYPTVYVRYSKAEDGTDVSDDVELMYAEAAKDIRKGTYTQPKVTYEADVEQFERAGMDVTGIAVGDWVQCIDRGFNEDMPLELVLRVTKMEVDELTGHVSVTLGEAQKTLVDTIRSMRDSVTASSAAVSYMSTATYVNDLLDRLNAEINATGGYTYIVPGEGIIVYDSEVADPVIGDEPTVTQVVQIKGGSIRIANERNASFSGIADWNWRSVFTSGYITADLVTAAQLVSGRIQSANGSSWWDLDSNEFHTTDAYLSGTVYATAGEIGGFTIGQRRIYNDAMSLSSSGLRLTSIGVDEDEGIWVVGKEYDIGLIGTSRTYGNPGIRGLSFSLEWNGGYMGWQAKNPAVSATDYILKFAYFNHGMTIDGYDYRIDTIYAMCDMMVRGGVDIENGSVAFYHRMNNASAPYFVAQVLQYTAGDDDSEGVSIQTGTANGTFVAIGKQNAPFRVVYSSNMWTRSSERYPADSLVVRCQTDFYQKVQFLGDVAVGTFGSGGVAEIYTGVNGSYVMDGLTYMFKKGLLVSVS